MFKTRILTIKNYITRMVKNKIKKKIIIRISGNRIKLNRLNNKYRIISNIKMICKINNNQKKISKKMVKNKNFLMNNKNNNYKNNNQLKIVIILEIRKFSVSNILITMKKISLI